MLILKMLLSTLFCLSKGRQQLLLENAILRYQLGILTRGKSRVQIKKWDRYVLVWLTKRFSDWKHSLQVVCPETLVRWHRKSFSLYWTWKLNKTRGRPEVHPSVVRLIRNVANANPLWGAPRIHGELLKLGIKISQASVEKYMDRRPRKPSPQRWKTFLQNHTKNVVAIDFLLVPTIRMKLLWVLVVLSHDRRRILRFGVTHKPSREWTAQQIRNAHPFDQFPKILLHDRDRNFWGLEKLGIRQIITAYQCPWQNAYVERVIGTIRRECTDHIIPINEKHLSSVLSTYQSYYNKTRTHLTLNKDSPISRSVTRIGNIVQLPEVGGLHTKFTRIAV